MPSDAVVVVVTPSSCVAVAVNVSDGWNPCAAGSAMAPVPTLIFTSNWQAGFWESMSESQVHQTFHAPPELYCAKTPTPSPGAALIV
jgi:hypothetical protein